jgi:hypothetical protein
MATCVPEIRVFRYDMYHEQRGYYCREVGYTHHREVYAAGYHRQHDAYGQYAYLRNWKHMDWKFGPKNRFGLYKAHHYKYGDHEYEQSQKITAPNYVFVF